MDKNENIAKHIWHDILQNSRLPWTWKFEFRSVKTIENGTSLRVNAKFIVGLVEIVMQEDKLFTILIKPDNFGSSFIYHDVSPDNLISQIHRVIEEGIIVDNRKPSIYQTAV